MEIEDIEIGDVLVAIHKSSATDKLEVGKTYKVRNLAHGKVLLEGKTGFYYAARFEFFNSYEIY